MKKSDFFIGDIRKCINYYNKSESLYYYVFDLSDVLFPFSYRRFDVIRKILIPSGDICYEDAVYKRNAVLLRIGCNQFIDLDSVNSVFDIYKSILYYELYDYNKENLVMPISPYESGSLFVDVCTLKPFFPLTSENEKISIRRLIKERRKDIFN